MRIWVPGTPMAQPRVKATIRGAHAGVYTPSTANAWKAQVVHEWLAAGHSLYKSKTPLRVKLIFNMPRPKGHYGTGRNAGRLKTSAPYWHTNKPDIDNLAKAVLDALKGHAWADDSQICVLSKHKRYDSMPGCAIEVIRA